MESFSLWRLESLHISSTTVRRLTIQQLIYSTFSFYFLLVLLFAFIFYILISFVMSFVSSPLHLLERARSAIDFKTIERALFASRQGGFEPQQYDVDPHTGFFPPEPLPKLPTAFSIWEEALLSAQGILCLSENQSEEALALRSKGETWRSIVRSVSTFSQE